MSYFSNASAPPAHAVAVPHDGNLPEAEVMSVEQVQANAPDRAQAIRKVEHMGMPRGLAEQFVQSARDFSYRFWIIDNSGSMGTNDGHRVVDGAGGRQGLVPCSRWEELGSAIGWHARLAVELGAWTEFRLLNQPGSGASQIVAVGTGDNNKSEDELRRIDRLVYSQPTGRTPLCAQIRAVTRQIQQRASEPARDGHEGLRGDRQCINQTFAARPSTRRLLDGVVLVPHC